MSETFRLPDTGWFDAAPLARALKVLDGDGEEARVVGGAARNALMGLPLNDIDIATTAVPEEVMRRAAAAKIKALPTGIEHGTVTLVVEGRPFEVTTLRQDVETFGRKAKVAFGRDWQTDAERRDFTMNALSISRDCVVHDYVGGLADLRARRVRFIGDPALRIAEDYLRILRFFRFHAAYAHGAPDGAGLHACIAGREGLRTLSRERVRLELMKLLVAPLAAATLAVMAEAGLLQLLLGGVPLVASFAKMVEVEASIAVPPDPVRRLGAVGMFVTEDAERLWQKLRLFNVEHERLLAMADGWWRITPAQSEASAHALLYRLGPTRYIDRALLAWSRAPESAADGAWQAFATLPARWTAPAFPLRAAHFAARGFAPGPALGEALRAAEAAWIAAGFPRDKATLDAILDDASRAAKDGLSSLVARGARDPTKG
jgi:poly(A) polymerase